jgi:hypothetical protein
MANLFPVTTGLPMTVWVSPRGSAGHDVRIKGRCGGPTVAKVSRAGFRWRMNDPFSYG